MIYLYSQRGCPTCDAATDLMHRRRVEFVMVYVTNQKTADALLKAYPQMKCDTCVYGLLLPFAVDITNEKLIGNVYDLHRHVHEHS